MRWVKNIGYALQCGCLRIWEEIVKEIYGESTQGNFSKGIRTVYNPKWDRDIQDKILTDLTYDKNVEDNKRIRYPLNQTNVYMALSIRNKIAKEQRHIISIRWIVVGIMSYSLLQSIDILAKLMDKSAYYNDNITDVYKATAIIVSIIVEVVVLFQMISKHVFSDYIKNDYSILSTLVDNVSNTSLAYEHIDSINWSDNAASASVPSFVSSLDLKETI